MPGDMAGAPRAGRHSAIPLPSHLVSEPLTLRSYEIREDIADVLKRVGPYLGEEDRVAFSGWARMAQTIDKFAVTEVRKPKVGENKPAAVTGGVARGSRACGGAVQGSPVLLWAQLLLHGGARTASCIGLHGAQLRVPACCRPTCCSQRSLHFRTPRCLLPHCHLPPAAEITINTAHMRPEMRSEWDELKQHDVLFLLTIRPPDSITANYMAQVGAPGREASSRVAFWWRGG